MVIVDALGREVGRRTQAFPAGLSTVDAPTAGLASGVYHARVTARVGDVWETQTSRFTLVR